MESLLDGIESLHAKSEVCARVCRQRSGWFRANVVLQQGCGMSP